MTMKAFVINLDRRPDRMQQLNVPIDFERFPATDGTQFTDEILKMRGHIGCWDSHRRLLKRILDEKLDMALVLEDDVTVCDEFMWEFYQAYKELPEDWDLLYLGGWNTAQEIKPYSPKLNIAERVLTTHAYLVRDKFVPKLLETLEGRRYKVDVVFCDALPKGKCFIANPVVAWQRDGYSDITNSTSDNRHLKL